jgi:hypothetical protein
LGCEVRKFELQQLRINPPLILVDLTSCRLFTVKTTHLSGLSTLHFHPQNEKQAHLHVMGPLSPSPSNRGIAVDGSLAGTKLLPAFTVNKQLIYFQFTSSILVQEILSRVLQTVTCSEA